MLTPMDDYPIHQTSAPLAQKVSSDPNHYDRYFFNGYTEDYYFGVAMAHYPNRGIIDAAVSVVHGGTQRSIFASGRIPADPSETRVGPIGIEIVEPLRVSRITVDSPDEDVSIDITFTARTAVLEEPRQVLMTSNRISLDNTRMTQWGRWSGSIHFGEINIDLEADVPFGVKDRSWGTRPVGDQPTVAPGSGGRQFFFLWAPINFDDRCTHFMTFDGPVGERHVAGAAELSIIGADEPTWGNGDAVERTRGDLHVDWEPGLRRARDAQIVLHHFTGKSEAIDLEPLFTFRMRGIGYGHPVHKHGTWLGDDVVRTEIHSTDELDSVDPTCIHVQQIVRATDASGSVGIGALELYAIGPHAPTGLTGTLDGYGPN